MSDLFQNHAAKSGPVECLGQTFPSDEARREHYLKLLAEKLKDPAFRKRIAWSYIDARDPLGHRPLFWHRQPGFFAFASPLPLWACTGNVATASNRPMAVIETILDMVVRAPCSQRVGRVP